MKSLAFISAALLLGGCHVWPSHGEGGVAEYRAPEPWFASEAEQAFIRELASLEAESTQLALRGGLDCQPAQVLKVRRALVRTKRDFYGQMRADAERSMKAVKVALGHLHWNEQQLSDCYLQRAEYYVTR